MSSCGRLHNLGYDNLCKCSFTNCDKWGKCCSCVLFHREKGGIPGCFFSTEAEKAGNRDLSYFINTIRTTPDSETVQKDS